MLPLLTELPRAKVRLLKNSFMPLFDCRFECPEPCFYGSRRSLT